MSVRWGLLSTAHINDLILAGARRSDRLKFIAVASRNAARAQDYARANEIERGYGSYEALLADPDVEVVYISLPNGLHVPWSVRALEAGKHVLCEKPRSRRARDVEHAFEVARREGRLLMEAFMYRHNPQTFKLSELVEAGAIGSLQLVRSTFSFTVRDPENVRLRPELDGGSLMDVGCYCVSGARLLAGEPERVYGDQVLGPSRVDIRFSGTLHFPNGVVSQFDSGLNLPVRDELEAIGDAGSIFLDDPWHCRTPRLELRGSGSVETIAVAVADSYQLELENLSDAVRGEAEPLLGPADAVGQARAIEALYRSAEEGRSVLVE
ncbi:MAG: Gfo/Idh/MocA family oxidoreductase [Actinomycetota bacterium]|nr:Gfo/Idh/MocA family oxidoreductase [Actinomycetota bacterium]